MDAPHLQNVTSAPAPIPFHAARAYGLRAGPEAASTRRADVQDTVELTSKSAMAEAMRDRVAPLIAARVDQPVEFAGGPVAPKSGALQMYRHPADKNAAATGVDLGRRLDLRA